MSLEKDRRSLISKYVERILDNHDFNMLYDLATILITKDLNNYSYDNLVREIKDMKFYDLLGEDLVLKEYLKNE